MVEGARKIEILPAEKEPELKEEVFIPLKAYEIDAVKESIKNLNRLSKRWRESEKIVNKRKYSTQWVSPIFAEIEMLNERLKDPVIEFGYDFYKKEWEKDAKENIMYQPERGREVKEFAKEAILEAKERIRLSELGNINENIKDIDNLLNWPERPDVWLSEADYNKLPKKELEEKKMNRLRNNWAAAVLGNIQNSLDYFKKGEVKSIKKRMENLMEEFKKDKYQAKKSDSEQIKAEKLKNKRELILQVNELASEIMPMLERLRQEKEKSVVKVTQLPLLKELREAKEKSEAA